MNDSKRLSITPLLHGQYFCEECTNNNIANNEDMAALFCASIGKNAAPNITKKLDSIGPKVSPSGKYSLGYTLIVPLMRYFYKTESGQLGFNNDAMLINLSTVNDVDRPVVIYLSLNHFTDSNVDLCNEIARDETNVMWNRDGPLEKSDYFNNLVIPWTLSDMDAQINIMRIYAFKKASKAIASLQDYAQERIIAVSLLGEIHNLFPNFIGGPNYDIDLYNATDYSPKSIIKFQQSLSNEYSSIDAFNDDIGASFLRFEDVTPPSKDIRKEELNTYCEHFDKFASGHIPVYGWVHDKLDRNAVIKVYLDCNEIGTAQLGLSRTDVTDSIIDIKDPNIGFSFYIDYRNIAIGVHTIDVIIHFENGRPLCLAKRNVVVVDRMQGTPPIIDEIGLDYSIINSDINIISNLDSPENLQSLFYNKLARLWMRHRDNTIREYYEYFAFIAINSGIKKDKLFCHQMLPGIYGGWNAELVSTECSLKENSSYNIGVTLYGGAAFGCAIRDFKKIYGWGKYSVGEMHPVVCLTSQMYLSMFENHRRNGAVFVSPYYISMLPDYLTPGGGLDRFEIQQDNHLSCSNLYYESIRYLMNNH